MKTTLFMFFIVLLISCTKDSPSLHEQMVGKWRVESYATEHYHPATNSSSRIDFNARPDDKFEFLAYDRILVDFDTAVLQQWNYRIIDRDNLDIEGRPWRITRLNEREFHLSLSVRDTSFKNGDAVIYRLKRP